MRAPGGLPPGLAEIEQTLRAVEHFSFPVHAVCEVYKDELPVSEAVAALVGSDSHGVMTCFFM